MKFVVTVVVGVDTEDSWEGCEIAMNTARNLPVDHDCNARISSLSCTLIDDDEDEDDYRR